MTSSWLAMMVPPVDITVLTTRKKKSSDSDSFGPQSTKDAMKQVKPQKIQAGVQVSRLEELRRHLQLWKRFGRLYFVVFVLDRNIPDTQGLEMSSVVNRSCPGLYISPPYFHGGVRIHNFVIRQEGNALFGIQDLSLRQELLEYMDVHDNDASESSQPSWGKMCTSGTSLTLMLPCQLPGGSSVYYFT
ncbi:hypothetical protein Tco_0005151 [Tanacetum coccineum]